MMVYCGKPSKACAPCRAKRLKCDQRQPGCSQCRNAGVGCPGYRSQLDLRFRNESDRVIQRYTPENKNGRRKRSNHDSSGLVLSHDHGVHSRDSSDSPESDFSDIYCIQDSVNDVATSFLLNTYLKGSRLSFVPSLYKRASVTELIYSVTQTVALASLAGELDRPEIMKMARYHYSESLKITKDALQCPTRAVEDGTLASVMLLALFETLSHDREDIHPDTWASHVNGALTLLTLRGDRQFETPIGRELFNFVGATIRVNCFQRSIRVPIALKTLHAMAAPYYTKQRVSNVDRRFPELIESFIDLRAAIIDETLTDPTEIILWAEDIERQISAVTADMPRFHPFDIVTTDRSKQDNAIFNHKYHLYATPQDAMSWNTCRMACLVLNEIISTYATQLAETDRSSTVLDPGMTQMKARLRGETAIFDILYSTPQFLTPSSPSSPRRHPATAEVEINAGACYTLIWPLFVAARSCLAPKGVREYCIGRLRYMYEHAPVPQAARIAAKLERGDGCENSLHMFHVF